jgi:glutamate formiminotransferase
MQNLSKNEGINIKKQSKKMLEENAIYVYLYISSSTIPETEDLIALNPNLIS